MTCKFSILLFISYHFFGPWLLVNIPFGLKIVFIIKRNIQFRGHTVSGETGCVWSVLRTPEDCLASLDTVTYHQPSLPPLPLASTRWAPTNGSRRATEVGGECLYGQHLARHQAAQA